MIEKSKKIVSSKTYLGFWLYLMTDAMLFATLFATYMILRHNTNGGETTHQLFEMPFVMLETIILLASSVTCGIAYVALRHNRKKAFVGLLLSTLILGALFLGLELYEFRNLVTSGNGWSNSAFLSAYFTLVGVHGLHITVGLLWGTVVGWAIVRKMKNVDLVSKFGLFTLFWHFLDIVWIFIFTIVYVLGVL